MGWLPRLSALVENVAMPAESIPVPSVAPPSLKVTVPVGNPSDPLTVAVKVMDWPKALGLAEELSAVVEPEPPLRLRRLCYRNAIGLWMRNRD